MIISRATQTMIYFLCNNSHQLFDARHHLETFRSNGHACVLLQVPHSLVEPDHSGFESINTFRRFEFEHLIRSWLEALSIGKRLRRDICPSKDDILFLYTEYEPFNQLIATYFKRVGARIYLIEDGGFATYVLFKFIESEPLSIKEKAKEYLVRAVSCVKVLRFHKLNGIIFPRMSDELLNGVCLYRPTKIRRKIKTFLINRRLGNRLNCTDSSVIFLNERMYDQYQTPESYLLWLDVILKSLCDGFETVYFKFHPRESTEWKSRIYSVVLGKYPSLIIIDDDRGIENIISNYRISVAASYFSAALLNLHEIGVEPLYLYHLIDDLRGQIIYRTVTEILSDLGYAFISSFLDIGARYSSCLSSSSSNPLTIDILQLLAEDD